MSVLEQDMPELEQDKKGYVWTITGQDMTGHIGTGTGHVWLGTRQ